MGLAVDVAAELAEMRGLIQAQQAQIEALTARVEKPVRPRRPGQEQQLAASQGRRRAREKPQQTASLVRSASRRDLLRLGGAAVGAAGLAAIVGIQRPQPAEAAASQLLGAAINGPSSETVIRAGSTALGDPADYSGNFELLLLDASTNPQANKDLRGLRVQGSGAQPGMSSVGGAINGDGIRGIGGGAGRGVFGQGGGSDGVGVWGMGGGPNGRGAMLLGAGTGVPLYLGGSGSPGPPGSGNHLAGDVTVDIRGIIWLCVATGSPGTWAPLQPGQGTTSGTNVFYSAGIITQPTLLSSDGITWTDMDTASLKLTITPAFNCLAVISGSADLWTDTAGYNQDMGIAISGGAYPFTAGQPEAWKESGGPASFSPNAAFVQTAVPLLAGTAYTIKLQWKTSRNAPGAKIWAGAGPIGGNFSPTSLTAYLIPTA